MTKISQFVCLAYLFLYFPMKIEHIIYVLAKRIINFHLFLQKICDLELWTPIPYENTSQKFQLWTPGHISGSRMNFEPKSILGGTLGCTGPRKTGILMAQGSPLAGQLTKVGILLVDPFRVHRTRSGSTWYLKG